MIHSIQYSEKEPDDLLKRITKPHAREMLLKGIEFKPGVNVILGNNGAGKSTIITAIAQHLAADQGGISKITSEWTNTVSGSINSKPLSAQVKHDGQGIRYFTSSRQFGLMGGMAALDSDFTSLGIQNIFRQKQSHGERVVLEMQDIIGIIKGAVPFESEIIADSPDATKHRAKLVQRYLVGQGDLGQKTLLLDEPEDGLSLKMQYLLWEMINENAPGLQIIVATQSMFCLGHPSVNYISLEKGWQIEMEAYSMVIYDRILSHYKSKKEATKNESES